MADNSPQGYMTLLAQNPEMMIEYLQKQVDELECRYQVLLEAHQRAVSAEKNADTIAVQTLKAQNRQLLHIILEVMKGSVEAAHEVMTERERKRQTPISECHFSTRINSALASYKITTLEQLCEFRRSELYRINNLGKKSIDEIISFIKQRGLSLADGEQ